MTAWPIERLGAVVEFDRAQGVHRGLPYVGMEHIESGSGVFLGTLDAVTVKSNTFRFDSRHVLYGRLRPYLNKVLSPDFEGHCSTEIFPLLPKPRMSRAFLHHWLSSDEIVERANGTCTGARMPRANMDAVADFEIPVPPLPEQRRIVAILDEAFAAIATAKANTEQNLANARAVFESHLNAVFTQPSESWVTSTIGEYIRFIDYRGKTPVKTDSGLRLITAKNVKMGFVQEEPMEFVSSKSYDAWMTRGIPKRGDVLFTTEAPLANVAQLDTDDKVVFAQRIIILQPDRSKIDPVFLKYLLLSQPVQRRIRAKGTGATVQGIKASLLRLIEISFPKSTAAQRTIAEQLDALVAETNRLESLAHQKLAALAALKASLLHHAFTGQLTQRPKAEVRA